MVHGSSIVYIPYLHLRKGVLDSNFIICDIYIKIKHYFYFLPNTVYITCTVRLLFLAPTLKNNYVYFLSLLMCLCCFFISYSDFLH